MVGANAGEGGLVLISAETLGISCTLDRTVRSFVWGLLSHKQS